MTRVMLPYSGMTVGCRLREIYGNPTDDMLQRAHEKRYATTHDTPDPLETAAGALDVDPELLAAALSAIETEAAA